ncbi:AAA ATPase central domain protein [Desulfonatronospira thiodismutans ASO3-1]|uniref:AAA ATPase central domain protein n=2 Tax=Desulfonatronospira thiodismutans TaxID=488939 RepID=D6SN36_9BACT|nr:AAA ATPase central domain protein [Desulfonatronospira thiodismutans ASO3-1]
MPGPGGESRPQIFERAPESVFKMDADDFFIRQKSAVYMRRTLEMMKRMDEPALEFVNWIVAGSQELKNLLMSRLGTKEKERILGEVRAHTFHTVEAWKEVDFLVSALEATQPRHHGHILKGVKIILDEYLSSVQEPNCPILENLASIQETFRLSEHESELILFIFLTGVHKPFDDYFSEHLDSQAYAGRKYLAGALGLNYSQLQEAMSGQLFELGLLRRNFNLLDLDEDISRTLAQGKAHRLNSNYFVKAAEDFINLKHHLLPAETIHHLLGLLKEKRNTPVHILLYGSPGTGKTTFARAIAHKINCPAYEIVHPEDNSGHGLRKAVQACVNITNEGQGALMIVDEAESLLETGSSFFQKGEVRDKGWLNRFMDRPGIRALWITNHVEDIQESTKRRFSFSLGFKKFNRSKRTALWNTVLDQNMAAPLMTKKQIQTLARDYDVTPGAMNTAVINSRELAGNRHGFYAAVRRSLDAYQDLLHDGIRPEPNESLQKDYSLEGLNFKADLEDFTSRMEKFSRNMSGSQEAFGINTLFYGPPGTGKSELVRYLGQKLDRELLIKYPSDILDPYVGMNERNIADAFQDAARDESILVFEEVDSFLSSRNMAQRSWEVNMVNEFLVRMERFKGILICTTNNYSWVDRAALRRFLFKVEFDYLHPRGRQIFYRKIICPLLENEPTRGEMDLVKGISRLTPGDFRVVRDRYRLLPGSELSHAGLIQALELETRMKDKHEGIKRLGF